MSRKTIVRTALFITLALLLGSALSVVLLRPVVVVHVTTSDSDGNVIPAVGDEVTLMMNKGLVRARTDIEGRVAFWLIGSRARWVPSLGPSDFPWRSKFSLRTRASVEGALACPSHANPQDFAKWPWQRVGIHRPPWGVLRIDLRDVACQPGHCTLKIEAPEIRYGREVNLAHVETICVTAVQSYRVFLVMDAQIVHTWPEVVVQPYSTKTLTVPPEAPGTDS
jgi:hypothetical protein